MMGHFAQVKLNETLVLDFDNVEGFERQGGAPPSAGGRIDPAEPIKHPWLVDRSHRTDWLIDNPLGQPRPGGHRQRTARDLD